MTADLLSATRELPDGLLKAMSLALWRRVQEHADRPRYQDWWQALALVLFEEADRRERIWRALTDGDEEIGVLLDTETLAALRDLDADGCDDDGTGSA